MKRRRPSELSAEEFRVELDAARAESADVRQAFAPLVACSDAYCSLLETDLPLDEDDCIELVEDENGQVVPKLVRASSVN
jgi:hypothetical protein